MAVARSVVTGVRPRPFGVDGLSADAHSLVTYAVGVADIDASLAVLRSVGFDLGAVLDMARTRPDGVELAWRLTLSIHPGEGGTIPFLIDWGGSEHPSNGLGGACTLDELTLRHPDTGRVEAALGVLGVDLPVESGDEPGVEARIICPKGSVVLA